MSSPDAAFASGGDAAASPSAPKSATVLLDLIDKRSWSEVIVRLRTHPTEATVKHPTEASDDETSYPLHEACKLQPPVDVVRSLLAAHRPALRHRGQFGYVPLHHSIKCEAALGVVRTLIDEYPYGARTKEDSGKLPLHLACQYGACPDMVNLLLMNHPQSIIMTDNNNKRPLDYATTDRCFESAVGDRKRGGSGDTANLERQIVEVLDRAAWYCTVSKAATLRASDEFEAKMTLAERSHHYEMEKLQECHERERQSQVETELGLRSMLETKKSQCDALTVRLEDLKAKTDEERRVQNVVHEELWGDFERERERANGLAEDLEVSENKLAESERTREKTEEELNSEIEDLENTVDKKDNEIRELNGDLREANAELKRRRAAQEKLEERVASRDAELARTETDLAELRAESKVRGEANGVLSARNEALTSSLADAEARAVRLKSDLESRIASLHAESEEAASRAAAERGALTERTRELTDALDAANRRHTEAKNSHSLRMIELEGMVAEANTLLQRREEEHAGRVQELEDQLDRARKEAEERRTDVEAARKEKIEMEADMERKVREASEWGVGCPTPDGDFASTNIAALMGEIQKLISADPVIRNQRSIDEGEEKKDEEDVASSPKSGQTKEPAPTPAPSAQVQVQGASSPKDVIKKEGGSPRGVAEVTDDDDNEGPAFEGAAPGCSTENAPDCASAMPLTKGAVDCSPMMPLVDVVTSTLFPEKEDGKVATATPTKEGGEEEKARQLPAEKQEEQKKDNGGDARSEVSGFSGLFANAPDTSWVKNYISA